MMLTPHYNYRTQKQEIIVPAREADDLSTQEHGEGAGRIAGRMFYVAPDDNRLIDLPGVVHVMDDTLVRKEGDQFFLPQLEDYGLPPQALAWQPVGAPQPTAPEFRSFAMPAAQGHGVVPPMPPEVHFSEAWTQPLEAATQDLPPNIALLQEHNAYLSGHNAYLSGQLEARDQAAGELKQQVRDLQTTLSKAPTQGQVDGLLHDKKELASENLGLRAQVTALTQRLGGLGAENHQLTAQVNGLQHQLRIVYDQGREQANRIRYLEALLQQGQAAAPTVYVGPGTAPPPGTAPVPPQRPAPGTEVPRRLYDPKAQ
jgi:hypothetical protein